jgi:hypothetical protein
MIKRARVILLFLVSLFLSVIAPISATGVPDEQLNLFPSWEAQHPESSTDKSIAGWFNDFGAMAVASTSSGLIDVTEKSPKMCNSLEECATGMNFQSQSLLDFCKNTKEINCIVNFTAKNSQGKTIGYKKQKYIPEQSSSVFSGDPDFRLPNGSTASVVEFPGLKNGAGAYTYAVGVYIIQRFKINDRKLKVAQFQDPLFLASVSAVSLSPGRYVPRIASFKTNVEGGAYIDTPENNLECVVLDEDICGKPVGFPPKASFTLNLRMNAQFYGWLHGRLGSANFKVTKVTEKFTEFEISGEPFQIPSAYAETTIDKLTDAEFEGIIGNQRKYFDSSNYLPILDIISSVRGTRMLSAWALWEPYIKTKAIAMPSVWAVRNIEKNLIDTQASSESFECLKKFGGTQGKILGFVNTNATVYMSSPPVFNPDLEVLEYQVAAPHSSKDGSAFKGVYTLKLDTNVARCLFGISGTRASATIAVVNPSGVNSVKTTIVNQVDGWFNFAASGFTFSNPKIRINLKQVK